MKSKGLSVRDISETGSTKVSICSVVSRGEGKEKRNQRLRGGIRSSKRGSQEAELWAAGSEESGGFSKCFHIHYLMDFIRKWRKTHPDSQPGKSSAPVWSCQVSMSKWLQILAVTAGRPPAGVSPTPAAPSPPKG